MGAVFEAVNETIERRVAIKLLHPEFAQNADVTARFFNEARAVNRIEHPGLVQISDYARLPDGTSYIVMEFLRGENLASHIKRMGGKLSIVQTLMLGWQVADALAAAHSKGIVHRDLKPENLMLVADSVAPSGVRAKLLDFGIAKLAEGAQAAQVKTRTDVIMGTPRYMSPEQCRGAREVDDKADVYALGIMLYFMLAGRTPFDGEGVGEIIAKHIFEPVPELRGVAPEVPEDVASYVHSLLAKDKNQRPSMKSIFEELGKLVVSYSGPASGGELRPSGLLLPLVADKSGSVAQEDQSERARSSKSSPVRTPSVLGPTLPDQTVRASTPAHKRAPRLLVAVSVLVLASGGLLAYRLLNPPHVIPPAPVTPPTPAPPIPPRTVTWSIKSDPAGAEIIRVRDGQMLGKTPWQGQQSVASGVEDLRLKLSGYGEHNLSIDQRGPVDVSERLNPTVPPSPNGAAIHADAVRRKKQNRSKSLDSKNTPPPERMHDPVEAVP